MRKKLSWNIGKKTGNVKVSWVARFFGLPLGILMGIGIVLSLITGWYTRAVMEANSQLNPIVLIIALLSIAVFTSIFYKKHRWEMNEQYYKELLHKKINPIRLLMQLISNY